MTVIAPDEKRFNDFKARLEGYKKHSYLKELKRQFLSVNPAAQEMLDTAVMFATRAVLFEQMIETVTDDEMENVNIRKEIFNWLAEDAKVTSRKLAKLSGVDEKIWNLAVQEIRDKWGMAFELTIEAYEFGDEYDEGIDL